MPKTNATRGQGTSAPSVSHRRIIGIWSLRAWGVGVFALPIHACYFSVVYLLLRGAHSPGILDLLLLVVALELYFAYGVLVNDFFDRELDIRAGKSSARRGHSLTKNELTVVLCLQLVGSAVVITTIGGGLTFDLLWAVAFGLATVYSAPPLRLRARGFAGFLVDSVIEKPLPILITFSLFGYYGLETLLFPVFGELLDSIFKHQIEDFDSDSGLGVRTFAVEVGKERSKWAERSLIHPINVLAVLSLFLISYVMLPSVSWIILLSSFLVGLGLLLVIILQRKGRVRPGFPFPEPPVVGFLNLAFRVVLLGALALALLVEMPQYYPLAILVVLSIVVYLKGHVRLLPDFLSYLLSAR